MNNLIPHLALFQLVNLAMMQIEPASSKPRPKRQPHKAWNYPSPSDSRAVKDLYQFQRQLQLELAGLAGADQLSFCGGGYPPETLLKAVDFKSLAVFQKLDTFRAPWEAAYKAKNLTEAIMAFMTVDTRARLGIVD